MRIWKLLKKKIALHRDSISYWRSKGAVIGDNCQIYTSAHLGSEPYLVMIGNNVRINEGVVIDTHDGGVWVLRNLYKEYSDIDHFGKVIIGDNVHIGNNSVILPGVTIGSNVIIGVGSVVTKDIPDNSIAVGVPARVIESIDDYIEKNKERFVNTKHMVAGEKRSFLTKLLNEQPELFE